MNECFMVFTGGSGSMVLESLAHMAAVGALDFAVIHVLMMDVDHGNGNLARTLATIKHYNAFRESMGNRAIGDFFQSELKLYIWTPYQPNSLDTRNIEGMISGDKNATWFAHALYTEEEIRHEVPVGFKGHPNLGVLFLQSLFDSTELRGDLDRFIEAFVRQRADRLMLVGSCFGGTGAASIPVFGHYLRKRIRELSSHEFSFALLALQPYFDLPAPPQEDLPIESSKFVDKVMTVLNYYPQSVLQSDPEKSLYDHVYLLGSSRRVRFPVNSSGKNTQENPANLITWYGCVAIRQFFTIQNRAMLFPRRTKLHLPWVNESTWDWKHFSPQQFPTLARDCAKMMQAAMLYICALHEPVTHAGSLPPYSFLNNMLYGLDTHQRTLFANHVNLFTDYIARYVNWFFQIITHLPYDGVNQRNQEDVQASFVTFHKTDFANIQAAFAEVFPPVTAPKNGSLSPEQLRLREYRERQLDSLFHQKFFNAFLLCKLEHKRMDYWPFQNLNRIANNAAVLVPQPPAAANEDTPIDMTTQPLGVAINQIVGAQYLEPTTSVDRLVDYMRAQVQLNDTEEVRIYRHFMRSMFGALDHFQR